MCFVEEALILFYILGQPQPGHRKENWNTSPQPAVKGTNNGKEFTPSLSSAASSLEEIDSKQKYIHQLTCY